MKRIYFLLMSASVILFTDRCAELPNYDDTVKDNIAPRQVTVTDTTNFPGGAIIRFALPPQDADLLGVIAEYSRREGDVTEAWASTFRDSIVVEGFTDTIVRIVRLITVDQSRNRSEPLEVRIRPLTSPLEHIRQSLQVSGGFGSIVATWQNPSRASIGVLLYSEDDSTGLATDLSYYSSAENGIYLFKEFEHRPRSFRIRLKDRWGNYSEPLDTVLTPLSKARIPSMNDQGQFIWSRYGDSDNSKLWRGDCPLNGGQNYFYKMYNENRADFWGAGYNNTPERYISTDRSGEILLPLYFTIDLGKSCAICEHKLFHDQGNEMGGQNLKKYEIWATNETPKQTTDFATQLLSLAYWTSWAHFDGTDQWKTEGGWTKIADCETVPNSGSSTPTSDDMLYAKDNGFTFDIFPEYTGTPFRYIRVVVTHPLWANTVGNPRIAEFELYGSVIESDPDSGL
ncbi:MAG: DUF4959 domain-containing protein [Bacteroidales bacterium]|jgi:hypothetical protein|nr:DUF4959 domain-containing protein [Bacteroidales bacterium]